MKVACKVYKKA